MSEQELPGTADELADRNDRDPGERTFAVATYRPDGGFTGSGVMMLISAMVIAGGILGFLAHWISQYFYLILLFPAAIGFVLGLVGMRMVKMGRVRNPWIGGIAGFVGGVFAMLMMHHFDYQSLRSELQNAPSDFKALAEIPREQRGEYLQDLTAEERAEVDALLDAYAIDSFWEYLDFAATIGVEIGNVGSTREGMNLGYYGTWIYWLVELLIVAGITFAMVRASTAEPFCVDCGQWKDAKVLGYLKGSPGQAQNAIASGDLAAIGAVSPGAEPTALAVTAATCGECAGRGDVNVKLEHLTTNRKGETQKTELAHMTYPAEALSSLQALFQHVAPPSQS